MDGSADDNEAPDGGKSSDSEESNDWDNNQEPIWHDCELDTLSKPEQCSNPQHNKQITAVNCGRDTPLGSAAYVQGNQQCNKSVQSFIDANTCVTLKVLHLLKPTYISKCN